MTGATARVLGALLADPTAEHYGYDLLRTTGLKSGALYPILERLHGQGWVERSWESLEAVAGRPPRRYYRLTASGEKAGRESLRAFVARERDRPLRTQPA